MNVNAMHLAAYRRGLRAKNRSMTTIAKYERTLQQLAAHYGGADLLEMEQKHLEDFIGATLERTSSATAAGHFRTLHAFYGWAAIEEFIERSPMARMTKPSVTERPIPVLADDELRALLKTCAGKAYEDRRDAAIIRLFCEPGSPRVSEMAGLQLDDVNLTRDLIRVHGKGDRFRDIPFGPKTGQAIDRYLLVRRRHRLATLPALWFGGRGKPLTASGVEQMLGRRSSMAGIGHVHPHQLRHTAAHVWHRDGGSEADAL